MTNEKNEQKTEKTPGNSYAFNYLEMFKSLFDGSQEQLNKNSQTQNSRNNQIYQNTSFYRTFV